MEDDAGLSVVFSDESIFLLLSPALSAVFSHPILLRPHLFPLLPLLNMQHIILSVFPISFVSLYIPLANFSRS